MAGVDKKRSRVGRFEGRLFAGAVIGMAALASSCGVCQPIRCIATHVDLSVTSGGGLALSGVRAVVMEPQSGSLTCSDTHAGADCWWSGIHAGTFSVEVSAPGFETKTVRETVTVDPPSQCGCTGAHVEPPSVSLEPSP